MNAPTKITLHRPTFQGDHVVKISLAPVPGTTDAKRQTYGKTPLEVYQESRIPLGGALSGSGSRKPAAVAAREMLDPAPILAELQSGPKTGAKIARALSLPVERITRALTHLRSKKLVHMQDRKRLSESNLWALISYKFTPLRAPIRPKDRAPKGMTFAEYVDKVDRERRAKWHKVLDAIRGGAETLREIAQASGFHERSTADRLTELLSQGAITRTETNLGGKAGRRVAYEVAQ